MAAASAATLVYGALVESNRLVIQRSRLRLAGWPERLANFKIAVIGDLHLRDEYTCDLGRRAIAAALAEEPDMVVLPGDTIAYWKPESLGMLADVLEPLLLMNGNVVAVPGNHEYWSGTPALIRPIYDELNIKLLQNEAWRHGGVTWAGVDSAAESAADPFATMRVTSLMEDPVIVVWHEPDLVDWLPSGACLMISGHSHGGQFRLPNGWAPMYTRLGKKYVDGFYPEASTPLFVTRGIGTTGPPSRLFCPPTVDILTLESD
ncbi:MAG: metallophosphoesterase [Fimbriimonadaceae bacterium]|nr:metallophosphoesterase [Fimbriimonadaceae bacterium]